MLKTSAFFAVLFMVMVSVSAMAQPLTTKYYSLNLPRDWVVLRGPEKENEAIVLQICDQKQSVAAAIAVGHIEKGDGQKVIQAYAKKLATQPQTARGQTVFWLKHGKMEGYCLIREDATKKVMLILTVSGDVGKANFLYTMRSPYQGLVPFNPRK